MMLTGASVNMRVITSLQRKASMQLMPHCLKSADCFAAQKFGYISQFCQSFLCLHHVPAIFGRWSRYFAVRCGGRERLSALLMRLHLGRCS